MSLPHHLQQSSTQAMSSNIFGASARPPSAQHQHQSSQQQHGQNSPYPPYTSSAPVPATSFYRQDALDPLHHQAYLQSISQNKGHHHTPVTGSSSSEQKEMIRNEARVDEGTFAHLTPALKHLTDSLSLEQQSYPIPHHRQHLHQFLQQQQNQQINNIKIIIYAIFIR